MSEEKKVYDKAEILKRLKEKYSGVEVKIQKELKPLEKGRAVMWIDKLEEKYDELDDGTVELKYLLILKNDEFWARVWLSFKSEFDRNASIQQITKMAESETAVDELEIDSVLQYVCAEGGRDGQLRFVVIASPRQTKTGQSYVQSRIVDTERG